ncbi:MAG: hypothetical protein ACK4E8_01755 [Lacibacter sp.]
MRKTVLIWLLLMLGFGPDVAAQQKPAPKITPPVLQTFWGFSKGGSLTLEMALQLVDSSVWVISDKKERMRISRFMLVYRSEDRYEDDETGKVQTRFNAYSIEVSNTGLLPEKWRKFLYENIKREDELLVADIIVRDQRGEYLRAPDLKIVIQ